MSVRTTTARVQAILGKDYDVGAAIDLQQYVDSATVMVDRTVTEAEERGVTLTSAEQELIERWLSAHLYCLSDKTFRQRSLGGGASATYQGVTGMGLDATFYGQTAGRIDRSGALSAIAGAVRNNLGVVWLGRAPSDQTDYVDRD